MKTPISCLLTLALAIPAIVSCANQLRETDPVLPKRTVHFSSATQETRTGLTVGDEMVVYDWNKTDPENVHLFEMDADGQSVYGETLGMTTSEDWVSAHFKADFPMGGPAPYKYSAVIATKPDVQLSFVIPSEQHPDPDTRKDPDAEFLIGYSRIAYEDPADSEGDVVDLYFDRMAAMSRLAVTGFQRNDEKVVSITLNAENGLVGSASYDDIDFENASVRFVRDEGPGILTLSYGEGVEMTAGEPFYAYFVTIPGAAKLTSIEVVTDKYRYVRSIEGGKDFNFSEKTFKDIKLDLAKATAERINYTPVNYAKTSSISVDGTYLIVDANDAKIFKGATDGSYVTVSPENTIITDPDGSWADYEFTVENDGSKYYLRFNDGKYLICNYVSDNGSTGLYYVDEQSDVTYPYTLTTGDIGAFFFNTTQLNGSNIPDQFLYHNTGSDVFKIGGSGSGIGVHLYLKNGKLDRDLSFEPKSVTCTLGDIPQKPVLSGTYTTVTYSSSNDKIATVDPNGNVTPLAAGIVTITASAEEDDQYSAGTAAYTLEIRKLDRSMSFNSQNVTCTLDVTPEKPVLSGEFTTVTYSSSNNKIATVDTDGKVSPHTTGIVTITASAEEDDQYNAGSASYTLRIKSSSTFRKYVRVTSADQINLEGEYVIVYENGQAQKAFKPVLNAGKNAFLTTAANALDVTVLDNEIDASEVEGCQFMLANQDGTSRKFSLVVPEADGTTDYYFIVYGREDPDTGTMTVFFASPTATGYRSTFNLSTAGVLTINGNSNYNFQYSSSGYFTAGTGSSSNLYLFVRAEGSVKQKQTLSFAEPTVTWALGDDYAVGNSYDYPQEVSGAKTDVTYSCAPESVARIENGCIKIVGPGSATVTATAAATDLYYSATATYNLRILRAAPGGWVDFGPFNLENEALTAYLDDAEQAYTDTNDDNVTVMDKYVSGAYASISRKDCPNPVTIEWTNPASNATVISIFENESLNNPVCTQKARENATTADVYNLIPGRKYYYSVSENGTVWEKGFFSTTGRRRTLKVGDTKGRGYANNCRDLGGLLVSDHGTKKTIKYDIMFRGTNMDKTTEAVEWPILLDFMNVGMDIDLRNGDTAGSFGDQGSQNRYRPLPAAIDYTAPGIADGTNFDDLSDPNRVHEIFMAFYNTVKSGKAIYFHCYSGADRTGYIAMLMEGLLGVSEKDCTIDYELTSFSVSGGRYRIGRVQGQSEEYVFRQGIAFLRGQGQTGDTFQEKIENYLTTPAPEGPGISLDDIEEFKSLVLQ